VALRPASALAPDDVAALVGSTLTRDVAAGAAFLASDLEGVRGIA
jgi:hypothetical protein